MAFPIFHLFDERKSFVERIAFFLAHGITFGRVSNGYYERIFRVFFCSEEGGDRLFVSESDYAGLQSHIFRGEHDICAQNTNIYRHEFGFEKTLTGAPKDEAVKAAAQATKAKQSKKAPKPEETEETQANCFEIVSSLSDTIKAKTGAGKLYFVSDLREERREEIKSYMKITKQTFIINAVRKMLKTYPELLTGVKLKSLTENGKQNYYLERE